MRAHCLQLGVVARGISRDGTGRCASRRFAPRMALPAGLGDSYVLGAGGRHTCARSGGQSYCWGGNDSGQLGDGTVHPFRPLPTQVSGWFARVTAGAEHTCGHSGSTLSCWGRNHAGRVGDGTQTLRTAPVEVTGLGQVVQADAGDFHTCAVVSGGSVRCWGLNQYGQTGVGSTASPQLTAQPVRGIGTTDAHLAVLVTDIGQLVPAFSPGRRVYSLWIPAGTDSLVLTPTVSEPGAVVTVAGMAVASGTPSPPVPLAPGLTNIEVVVVSPDGSHAQTYQVLANRVAPAVSIVEGDTAATEVGTSFATPLTVDVRVGGQPVPDGTPVIFTAIPGAGGASLAGSPLQAQTSGGQASVVAYANLVAGSYSVTAAAGGGSTVFALENLPGSPATGEAVAGDGAATTVATPFAEPLRIRVRDAHGNAVADGTEVLFTAVPGANGASVPGLPLLAQTVAGEASLEVAANQVAGAHTVYASAGAASAQFGLVNLPDQPAVLSVVEGQGGVATVGTPFPAPLRVQVVDAHGNPVADGTPVAFTAIPAANGASLAQSPLQAATSGGQASVEATANTISGAHAVVAASGAVEAIFQLENSAAEAASFALSVGDGQEATVVTAFASPLAVRVVDAYGNPVAGTPVGFQPVPGSGGASADLAAGTVSSDDAGLASVLATANQHAGRHEVVAIAPGLGDPVRFVLDNRPGAADRVGPVSGQDQVVPVDSAFEDLVVAVEDRHGNPVPDALVVFQVAPGGNGAAALLEPAGGEVATDSAGRARIRARANGIAGAHVVLAGTAGAAGTVEFALSNQPGAAALLVAVAGDGQSAAAGSAVPVPPQVRVEDGAGNPVPAAQVVFAVMSGGGSVVDGYATTDSAGVATVGTWRLGPAGGSQTLAASLPGSPAAVVLFTATAIPQVDAGVQASALRPFTRVGAWHEHLVLVRNDGLSSAQDVATSVPVPDGHDASLMAWQCLPGGGAICPALSGTGAIASTVDLPPGASLAFLIRAPVAHETPDGVVELVAAVAALSGTDLQPGNDEARVRTPLLIYRDGFQAGGDGMAGGEQESLGELRGELRVDVPALAITDAARSATALPAPWLVLEAGNGARLAVVDRLEHRGLPWVRLRASAAAGAPPGDWLAADGGLGLALLGQPGALRVLVDTAAGSATLALPAGAFDAVVVREVVPVAAPARD